MKNVLILDDNDFYSHIMQTVYEAHNFSVFRASSAREGWELFRRKGLNFFDLIVADITMESQLSGLIVALKCRLKGYKKRLYLVSTGFNVRCNLFFSGMLLRTLSINRAIPKYVFHEASREKLVRWLI
ncbi:MAG: hypothetical protein ONB05_02845 [candidate division KSB1 bacterium]|nr:hypothetical protein [candidate division KSB1 bacterium]